MKRQTDIGPRLLATMMMALTVGRSWHGMEKGAKRGRKTLFSLATPIKQHEKPDFDGYPSRQMMRAALRSQCHLEVKAEFDLPRKARRRIARQRAKAMFKKFREGREN